MVLFFIVNKSEILLEHKVAALLLSLDPQKSSDGSALVGTQPIFSKDVIFSKRAFAHYTFH